MIFDDKHLNMILLKSFIEELKLKNFIRIGVSKKIIRRSERSSQMIGTDRAASIFVYTCNNR